MMVLKFQRKAIKKKKKKEMDSDEFLGFTKMISDAGMTLFPGHIPFPYKVLLNENGYFQAKFVFRI